MTLGMLGVPKMIPFASSVEKVMLMGQPWAELSEAPGPLWDAELSPFMLIFNLW